MINEKKLWQNVIITAVSDALNQKPQKCKYASKNTHDAKNWILYNNNWYFNVCIMAGIDPKTLREKIHSRLSNINQQKITHSKNSAPPSS